MKLIDDINKVLTQYLSTYSPIDIPYMEFSKDDKGNIYFNNRLVCSDNDLEFQFATIEIDCIILYFNKNRQINIELCWDEDTLPQINSFGYIYN